MRRTLITITTLALAAGGALLAAAPAQALPREPVLVSPATPALVWFQSFQRSGPDAPCVAPAELEISWQADWPAAENTWTPSWALWPNNGTGGWTCDRQITWAKGTPATFSVPEG